MVEFQEGRSPSQKDQTQQKPPEKTPITGISFPHGEVALNAFKKEFPDSPEKIAMMKRSLEVFFKQEMENTAIFTDSAGASLPYTKINVTQLAREIMDTPIPKQEKPPKHKRFFILPSFPQLQNGHQFTFVEEAIKQAMRYLPEAVEDLKEGTEPQDIVIYTAGSPTNKKWGQVTAGYVEKLKTDAYGTISSTYADFIQTQLPESTDERAKTAMIIFGQSQSSSMASQTALKLIEGGQATQTAQKRQEGVPYVQVIMDAPVTLNPSNLRKGEIISGFALDGLFSSITRPRHMLMGVLGEAGFLGKVAQILQKRGIQTHEGDDEIKLKKEGRNAVMNAMFNEKMPIDPSRLRVNIRRGTYDVTNPPFNFARRAFRKINSYKNRPAPIGKYLIQDPQLDITDTDTHKARISAVRGTHIFSIIFSKHEIQKWGNGIDRIQRALTQAT